MRELNEEAGLSLNSELVRYCGIVTWKDNKDLNGGMHAFIVKLPDSFPHKPKIHKDHEHEGILGWHDIEWAVDKKNLKVPINLPHFLPHMLRTKDQLEYMCFYEGNDLIKFEIKKMGEDL